MDAVEGGKVAAVRPKAGVENGRKRAASKTSKILPNLIIRGYKR